MHGMRHRGSCSVPSSSCYFRRRRGSRENRRDSSGLECRLVIAEHGAVSSHSCARCGRHNQHRISRFGIGITGAAGPAGGSGRKAGGLVFHAGDDAAIPKSLSEALPGDRDRIRHWAIKEPWNMVVASYATCARSSDPPHPVEIVNAFGIHGEKRARGRCKHDGRAWKESHVRSKFIGHVDDAVVEKIKAALAVPSELRLFRSGKLHNVGGPPDPSGARVLLGRSRRRRSSAASGLKHRRAAMENPASRAKPSHHQINSTLAWTSSCPCASQSPCWLNRLSEPLNNDREPATLGI